MFERFPLTDTYLESLRWIILQFYRYVGLWLPLSISISPYWIFFKTIFPNDNVSLLKKVVFPGEHQVQQWNASGRPASRSSRPATRGLLGQSKSLSSLGPRDRPATSMSTMSRSSAGDVPGPKDSWIESGPGFLGGTLPETNSSHLKMGGWNTSFLLGWPNFRGYVSFREGSFKKVLFSPQTKWGKVSHFDDYFSNRLVQPPIFMFVASRWETRLENNTSYTFMKMLVVGLKVDATTSN